LQAVSVEEHELIRRVNNKSSEIKTTKTATTTKTTKSRDILAMPTNKNVVEKIIQSE